MQQNDLWDNPIGTDGFEFVEFTAAEPSTLARLFESLGFTATAKHRSKEVVLYRQGDVNFILNAEPRSQAAHFGSAHGPGANAMALRVKDAGAAMRQLIERGAEFVASGAGPMELQIPAIRGIGGALVYLVDRYGDQTIYDVDFYPIDGAPANPRGVGLACIDHLTHNVETGHMQRWAEFYSHYFNFREIRHFDIEGKLTGLRSKAMTSPCGKIRIPINESDGEQGQIQEFLEQYRGEGIQHIALATADIHATVESLRGKGIEFMHTPDSYYERIDVRVPEHDQDLVRLRHNRILIDGAPAAGDGLLLQIFTSPVIGPIFFEIIQRIGNEGFGEGNFQALFESIEEDQIRRGVLEEGAAA
ncbi:MAG: 4-hydroxyphenylpyruvate dioxygenase [Gammaproteobacteria bacterium]|nr:4-hydroxyphenylpyruvate dioxygenase [Gammaproteobacteria bacterium]